MQARGWGPPSAPWDVIERSYLHFLLLRLHSGLNRRRLDDPQNLSRDGIVHRQPAKGDAARLTIVQPACKTGRRAKKTLSR